MHALVGLESHSQNWLLEMSKAMIGLFFNKFDGVVVIVLQKYIRKDLELFS